MARVWMVVLLFMGGMTAFLLTVSTRDSLLAQSPTTHYERPGGGVVVNSSLMPGAMQGQFDEQITVLDPRIPALAVYRVDAKTGRLRLCSVRNLQQDMQMLQFSNDPPLPSEMREMQARGGLGR